VIARDCVEYLMNRRLFFLAALAALLLTGCQSMPREPIATVENLDLERFMGDWYVIANIPTFIEKGAHNAVESYARGEGNRIETTFRFRAGAFDGPVKVYEPTGFVSDRSNAVWGMQFLWPIKAEFLVIYVDPDYGRTIIGRSARDYVWLMAREPQLSDAEYAEMLDVVERAGYDPGQVQKVPQAWPEAPAG
jgi:apolipoprotein D and lipocalin family protein